MLSLSKHGAGFFNGLLKQAGILRRSCSARCATAASRTLRAPGARSPTSCAPEEMDVFKLLGPPWIEPAAREVPPR